VRAITSGGGYSPWSSSIATFASGRNNNDPLTIKKIKFKDTKTKQKYAFSGKPEFEIILAKGDNVKSNIIYQSTYNCTTKLRDGTWENCI